jgi:anti-anti-sigma regulatory factor
LRTVLLDLAGETPRVVVDLAEVRLLDEHSVGMLVAAHRQASERDTILSMRGAAGTVLRVLEISGASPRWRRSTASCTRRTTR